MAHLSSIERVAAWATMPWLHAGFSTRQGGRSSVYGADEQNLGWTAEDTAETVALNRAHFVALAGEGDAMQLVTLQQIHGCVIRDLDRESCPLMDSAGKALLRGDGLLTRTPGRMLGVITADCVPVLVVDTRQRAVAAFHAGWRGTVERIVERGIAVLRSNHGSRPEDLLAAIGPSIGPCCFEVGEEVGAQFISAFSYAKALLAQSASIHGGEAKFHLDLQEANRRQLLDAGISPEHISTLADCTACTRLPDGRRKYFSHRAEKGVTGRMLSVIGIAGDARSTSSAMEIKHGDV